MVPGTAFGGAGMMRVATVKIGGRGRRAGATRIESLGWTAVAVSAIGLAYFLLYALPRQRALFTDESTTTTAFLIRKMADSAGKPMDYGAMLRFQDRRGDYHMVKNYYSPAEWEKLREGQGLDIRYVNADPTYAYDVRQLEAHRPTVASVGVPVAALSVLGALGVMCIAGPGRLRRQPAHA